MVFGGDMGHGLLLQCYEHRLGPQQLLPQAVAKVTHNQTVCHHFPVSRSASLYSTQSALLLFLSNLSTTYFRDPAWCG